MQRHQWLILAVLFTIAPGCARGQEPGEPKARPPATSERGLPLADLQITDGQSVKAKLTVDIAETPDAQATGLMNVSELPRSQGMIFLFERPTNGSFYMKNTLIPLDIAFWDESMKIIDIKQMQPCEADPCPTYAASGRYVGALEVNLGVLQANNVAAGDTVSFKRRS